MLPGHAGKLAATAIFLVSFGARAAEPPPEGRVVLVDPGDPTLVARVRGQAADLPYRFVVVPVTEPIGSSLSAAEALGQAHDAGVVVWLEPLPPRGFTVYVADVRRGELFARRLSMPESADRLADSALAEAAALIVRSGLKTVSGDGDAGGASAATGGATGGEGSAAGGSDGTTTTKDGRGGEAEPGGREARGGAAQDGEAPDADADADADAGAVDGRAKSKSSFEANVGYELGLDLPGEALHQGPAAFVAYRSGRWAFGVLGSFGLPRDLTDDRARLTLSRHVAEAGVRVRLVASGGAELAAELLAGAVLYSRSTEPLSEDVVATAPRHSVVPAARLGLDAGFFPGEGAVGAALAVGADVLGGPLRLRYAGASATVREQVAVVQPVVFLSLVVRSSPAGAADL